MENNVYIRKVFTIHPFLQLFSQPNTAQNEYYILHFCLMCFMALHLYHELLHTYIDMNQKKIFLHSAECKNEYCRVQVDFMFTYNRWIFYVTRCLYINLRSVRIFSWITDLRAEASVLSLLQIQLCISTDVLSRFEWQTVAIAKQSWCGGLSQWSLLPSHSWQNNLFWQSWYIASMQDWWLSYFIICLHPCSTLCSAIRVLRMSRRHP